MALAFCSGLALPLVAAAAAACASTCSGDGTHQPVDEEATVLLQLGRPKASVALLQGPNDVFGTAEKPEPVPLSFMRTVDKTSMVRKESLGGLVFYTYNDDDDEFVSKAITPQSYWEKDMSDRFCAEAKPLQGKAHFLDVGANIGTWAVPLAACLKRLGHGGQVYAIEAVSQMAHYLEASVAANSLDNVQVFNYGVGNATGKLPISVHPTNRGATSFMGPNATHSGISIPITTLDLILASKGIEPSRIFAMKMDVEGFEGYAMQGAKTLFRKGFGPCMIQVELLPWVHVGNETTFHYVGHLLAEAGYTGPIKMGQLGYADYIFQRSDYAECVERLQH